MNKPVFLSVGRPGDDSQKQFLSSLENYLRDLGLEPQTLNSTVYKADPNPLAGIADCLGDCIGMIVLAYERLDIVTGLEKGASSIAGVRMTTVWNHIEASLAFAHDLPVLVLVEEGIRLDGLLGNIYGWKVLSLPLTENELYTRRISETIRDWKSRCEAVAEKKTQQPSQKDVAFDLDKLTVQDLFQSVRRVQAKHIWGLLVAVFALLATVATTAFKLGSKH